MADDKIEKRVVESGNIDMGRKQEVIIQFRYNTKTQALRGVRGKAFYVAIDDSFFIPRKNFPAPPTLEDEFDMDAIGSYRMSGLTGEGDKDFVLPQALDNFLGLDEFSGELELIPEEEKNLPPSRRWRRRS